VGQGIHPGSRRDRGRQTQGHAGIENGRVGKEEETHERHLQMPLVILDYGNQGDLGTGARRGRHGN